MNQLHLLGAIYPLGCRLRPQCCLGVGSGSRELRLVDRQCRLPAGGHLLTVTGTIPVSLTIGALSHQGALMSDGHDFTLTQPLLYDDNISLSWPVTTPFATLDLTTQAAITASYLSTSTNNAVDQTLQVVRYMTATLEQPLSLNQFITPAASVVITLPYALKIQIRSTAQLLLSMAARVDRCMARLAIKRSN